MFPLIAPTTDCAVSVTFGIPPLVWSPDPDLVRGTTTGASGTVTNDYPGRALAPREITLVLHAAPGLNLPADAEATLEVRTSITPEHWEPIRTLNATRKAITWRGPIEDMRVRKADSGDDAYGVAGYGLFEPTNTVAS